MSFIVLSHLSLNYPIIGTSSRSLRGEIMGTFMGGKLLDNQKMVEVNALSAIDLSIQMGERVGLVGRNGSGKSSLLKLIAGVYQPSEGTCVVSGSVGAILALDTGLVDDVSGLENIKIYSMMKGLSSEQYEGLVEDVCEFSELGKYLYLPVKTYSSGMRTRLAFALSTSARPDILLIDEVIGVGDSGFIDKAKARIQSMVESTKILVLASHSNDIIRQFCNRVVCLDAGVIVADGPTDTILHAMEPAEEAVT